MNLIWLDRIEVEKGEGHKTYFDLYYDYTTKVEYIGHGDCLTARLNIDGTPVLKGED